MRIGGQARYFADITTRDELAEALEFANAKKFPLIILGGGSNTIFADERIEAVVVRVKADAVTIEGNTVDVEAGKILAVLIFELAKKGLDLSALTGIPGTIGGAVFGNAGQGPTGTWIDAFIETVTVFTEGEWREMTKEECGFGYRESGFKRSVTSYQLPEEAPRVIWSVRLQIPQGNPEEIQEEIERLLQRRIETQPHRKTAGSCFKAVGDTPAWQLIDAAGLRGHRVGDVAISEKHANFLMNEGKASFNDAVAVVEVAKQNIPNELDVEMRFIEADGSVRF